MAAKTIDEYLVGVSRGQIKGAAPGAEECIGYGQPAFRKGRVLAETAMVTS